MQKLQFPIKFFFKISTLSNDFTATDANGEVIAYVKQKMFKFKEDILIYSDENKDQIIHTITADKWLDFSAAYSFSDEHGMGIGKIVRKGWKSIWRTKYDLINQFDVLQYHIREQNPFAKVMDSLLGEIPILGFFTGYVFNPTYAVMNIPGEKIVEIKKKPSFLGREFVIEKVGYTDNDDDQRIILGLMMMMLLEKRRG